MASVLLSCSLWCCSHLHCPILYCTHVSVFCACDVSGCASSYAVQSVAL